ncbi:MAG TPA: type II toxin-antitoxin system VapC family toxin [Verrucomicrobiae bacterium]|nr:type II toxin-antitoxin system VapC family toxin [Verrucomicrobiae bacterium]
MAPSHLLDTSVYSQPLKPRPLPSVERHWRKHGDEALAVSVICEAELRFGIEKKQSAKLRRDFAALLQGRLVSFDVDIAIAAAFGELKAQALRKGLGLSDFDLLIAATAKTHALTVATLNVRHFIGLDGVVVEDWSR